jgi:pimeloyl-ACP methyl ester carboxylesterase
MPRADLKTGASLYYEEYGSGYPILLFAPGGMDSRIDFWHQAPWDPTVELASSFRVIAMDQRNAHRSFGPLEVTGWDTMVADQLALLDHLHIERTHVAGGCIGSSYCLRIIQEAPHRISAAVLQNPIGLDDGNFDGFKRMFTTAADVAEKHGMKAVVEAATNNDRFQQNPAAGYWAARIAAESTFRGKIEKVSPAEYARIHRETKAKFFEERDFVLSVSREWLANCPTPLLILAGHDDFHPVETAKEIANLAPNAIFVDEWAAPELRPQTVATVRSFLKQHTP